MGGSTGTAIYGAIFQSKAAHLVPEYVAAAVLPAGLPQSSLAALLGVLTGLAPESELSKIPGVTPAILGSATTALKDAYVHAFRYVWMSAIPFGVLAFIAAAASKDVCHSMNSDQSITLTIAKLSPKLTSQVAQHMKGDALAAAADPEKDTKPSHIENVEL